MSETQTQIFDVELIEQELIDVQLSSIDLIPRKSNLNELEDVVIVNPISGEVLTYDEVTKTWKNEPVSEEELANIILNETPISVNPLPSKRFRVANAFVTSKLMIFLNGQKIHTDEITLIDSNTFEFPINIISSDKVEVSYIKV